jgi:hypothetical protein
MKMYPSVILRSDLWFKMELGNLVGIEPTKDDRQAFDIDAKSRPSMTPTVSARQDIAVVDELLIPNRIASLPTASPD